MTVEQIIQGLAGLRDSWLDWNSTLMTPITCAKELDAELVLLREKLGRVLEAGQAMRDDYGQTLDYDPCERWDAAIAELPAGAGRGEGQDHG